MCLSVSVSKNDFLISQLKYSCGLWVLKRTVSLRRSFEDPEQMFKLMDNKIYAQIFGSSRPMSEKS